MARYFRALLRYLLSLSLMITVVGCTMIAPSKHEPVLDVEGLRARVNLNQVAFFPQEDYQCGPAALATVLTSQGVNVTPEVLVDKVYLPEQEASLPLEMVAAGRSYGLLAYKLDPNLGHLLQQVNAGHPVLVFQNLAFETFAQWHFAVIVGYDLAQEELILRSARIKEYRLDFKTFINTWQRANHWAYLFLTPGELPAKPDPKVYLQSSLDLVNVGLNLSAQKALEVGVNTWPEHEAIRMALSNTYFQSGLFNAASKVLQQSPSLGTSGDLWNNIAYIQLARQCYRSAVSAIQCAITLSPNDQNIQHSVQDILQRTDRPNGGADCPLLTCPKPVQSF